MHLTRLESAFGNRVFQHFRKPEHTAQIARRFAHHERRKHLGFGDPHARGIIAIALEQIDETERRRIVILAHFRRRLGTHLLGQHPAHGLLQHRLLPPRRAPGAALLQHGLARRPT